MVSKFAIALAVLVMTTACGSGAVTRTADDSCLGALQITPAAIELAVGDSLLVSALAEPCMSGEFSYVWRARDAGLIRVERRSDSTSVVFALTPGTTVLVVESTDLRLGIGVPVTVR